MLLGMPPVPGVYVLGIICGRQVTRVSGADLPGACQPGEPGELRLRVLPRGGSAGTNRPPRAGAVCVTDVHTSNA